jgi:hypothetical protein
MRNLNGHKRLNLKEIENMACCFRGMQIQSDSLAHRLKGQTDVLKQLIATTLVKPDNLPQWLQAIEWDLGQIVQDAATLLKEAGDAIDKCHSLRGGNETLVRLLKERQQAIGA